MKVDVKDEPIMALGHSELGEVGRLICDML